jgi:hypothetical protein
MHRLSLILQVDGIRTARFASSLRWLLIGALLTGGATSPAHAQPAKDSSETAEKEAPKDSPPEEENTDNLKALEELSYPTAKELITGKTVDWLVLKNKHKVIPVESVVGPRPGTLIWLDAKIKKGHPRGDKNEARIRDNLPYLNLILQAGDSTGNADYRIHRKHLEEIVYFEDMIIKRTDEALDKQEVARAYELLEKLESINANWPGLQERKLRLLFVDAQTRFAAGNLESSLAILQDLHSLSKNYSGLSQLLSDVLEGLVAPQVAAGDFRHARHFLERIRLLEPRNSVLVKWSKDLESRAEGKMRDALAAARANKPDVALDLIEEAARIWPQTSELVTNHRRLFENYQRLRVAVLDLPAEKSRGAYVSPADRRHDSITELRLFQPARVDERVVRYETRLFTEWEPENLGHSIRFRILQHRGEWESQPSLTAGTIVETIARRLDPKLPTYDARIASAVGDLSVSSPFDFRINFRQAPLKPEALFSIPVELSGGPGMLAPNGLPSWPFYVHLRDSKRIVYRRTLPEPSQITDRHLAELVEVHFADYPSAVQSLLRGETSLLPRVAPPDVKRFEQHGEFFVVPLALPETHILQFNPRSEALKNRTLRRALVYASNRKQILESVFLHEAEGRLGRQTSAPFATTSYAYDPLVKPHRFDQILAYTLAMGAKVELQTLPTLKMICPPDPEMRAAASEIVTQWNRLFEKKIGLKVVLLDAPHPGTMANILDSVDSKTQDPTWDIRYDVVRMAEPLVDLWQVVTLTTGTDLTTVQHIPTWLRQELLSLEQAGNMASVEDSLHRLHKHLWAEVHLIPLWELTPVMAVRKTVRSLPQGPINSYEGVEGWRLESWFPKDVFEPGLYDSTRR